MMALFGAWAWCCASMILAFAGNRTMMVCVSGAKMSRLVLDL
jgi:hypothetical protein